MNLKKHLMFAGTLFVLLMAIAIVYAQRSRQISKENELNAEARTVRGQAKIKGYHVIEASKVGVPSYTDVSSLFTDSSLVVVGTPLESSTHLHPPKNSIIMTTYGIAVTDRLKGDLEEGQLQTSLEMPGGLIQFEEGASAEMKMPDGWRTPEIGKKYIFFLTKRDYGYILTGGQQGLFEIKEVTNKVESLAAAENSMQKYNGRSIDWLLDTMRKHQ